MAGFKAGMILPDQKELGFNACVFATHQEAANAGSELMSRWYVPIGYEVVEVQGKPNYIFTDGKAQSIETWKNEGE